LFHALESFLVKQTESHVIQHKYHIIKYCFMLWKAS